MATYVIVGGVAGGASAAARLRRRDEAAEIIMVERGRYVSFANCGLPYYVGEEITERDALLVSTPEKLAGEFAIDVRTEHEVTAVDRAAHEVEVRNLVSGETYRLRYDKLILSPGARPVVPPVPGADLSGVFTLRNMEDVDRIKSTVDAGGLREAVVVGGGFIGLEMAENLAARGLQVTVVEMLDQVMTVLDFDMAAIIHRHLRDKGVRLGLGDGLKEITRDAGGRLSVGLASGRAVPADMVMLSIGVRPESELAKAAGLELGPRGHVLVNSVMQTSDPDVYALGDVVQIVNPVTGAPGAVPLAGPANRQARIAADHITGLSNPYRGTVGTAIAKVFDLAAASTGANSAALERQGIAFLTSITHSSDHVAYYPGAKPQAIKLFYTPDEGKILGAQVVGYRAVDRTIDILATAMTAGMTVFDLEHLELAYAPPFGAAKDPANIAGYVAANRLRGDSQMVEWRDVVARDVDKVGVLDVRTEVEWDLGHVPGAVHIENTEIRGRLDELERSKTWYLYCSIGRRSYVMERMLRQHGYDVRNISGGYTTYDTATEKQDNMDEPFGPTSGAATLPTAGENGVPEGAVGAQVQIDACGLQCPGPILQVYKKMQELHEGDVLEVLASDPGFRRDVAAWCERTGNRLLGVSERADGVIVAHIRKGQALPATVAAGAAPLSNAKTMIVFSADLDRALASFIIANGAAAMGQKVTLFFTFWGLNVLRKPAGPSVKKNLVERMFGWMMPKGAGKLKLSRLNMGGLGTEMMKRVMKSKNIDSLPALIASAQENGVRLIACQMTMDMMGIKAEELIDGVEIGGVATYIGETDKANASLFI